ncbi:immune-associated nucleotide-binding protein 6 [Plakobranchus ocellatus]|uniref:Immune-associated nucleotide-binding protein 6 n=1 Tax=Plakobranchus ocellatus TaxID=259542 RepID=A0AAV4DFW5_9GAST|nr:immune-associated nucleotide-binding protein 6 [Plakobranchus ocellatus]
MASGPTVNLHLIGKQGNGKSATGNSIVGKRVYRSRSSDSPSKISIPVRLRGVNFTLYLWDWPGTDGTQEKSKTIAKDLRKVDQEDYQFNIHLFGWVIRYGELYGQEEEEFLRFLISELGEDFLRNRTIVIVTCKDNFDRDVEEIQCTFNEWTDQQTGFFKHLRKKCNDRILPFDNRSQPLAQTDKLFNLIWTLASNLPKEVANYQRSGDRHTPSTHKQYPSKLPRLSESDRYSSSLADD